MRSAKYFGVDAGRVVGHQGHDLLDAVLVGPLAIATGLRQREAGAHDVGEASVMAEVAAAITTIGVLLCVAMGAVAMAAGVMPKPASATTFSCTTSSCARRRVVSGHGGVVLDDHLDLCGR